MDILPGLEIQSNAVLSVSCLNVDPGPGNLSVCLTFSSPRSMAGPSAALAWDLYGPSPSNASWSNTTPIAIPMTSLLSQSAVIMIPVSILASQSGKPPGAYAQTLNVSAIYGTSGCTGSLFAPVAFTVYVSATVLKACDVAANSLTFPTTSNLNAVIDGQTQLSVRCTSGTGYTVALNGGLAGVLDPSARIMAGPLGTIVYGLYRDAARTSAWGALAGSTQGASGTATTQLFQIYGRVPVQTTPRPGTYSDTVIVSVTY